MSKTSVGYRLGWGVRLVHMRLMMALRITLLLMSVRRHRLVHPRARCLNISTHRLLAILSLSLVLSNLR